MLRVICGGGAAKYARFIAKEVALQPPQNPSHGLRKLMLEWVVQAPTAGQIEVYILTDLLESLAT
jgi:hypothetical protein